MSDQSQLHFYGQTCKLSAFSVKRLIDDNKDQVATALNVSLTTLYWKIGKKINEDILGVKRAEYGKQTIILLAQRLEVEYGNSFSEKNLRRMVQFAEAFPDSSIVVSLIRQLSWTHILVILPMKDLDYYIDLLFYHRRLKCLIAIDLKIGDFEAVFKGQMELYLRYLEKYEVVSGENPPIGLILCTGKKEEHIELMQLEKSNIRVADYLLSVPSQKLLQQKLHRAIKIAQHKLEQKAK